jgi:hypothetical protein
LKKKEEKTQQHLTKQTPVLFVSDKCFKTYKCALLVKENRVKLKINFNFVSDA